MIIIKGDHARSKTHPQQGTMTSSKQATLSNKSLKQLRMKNVLAKYPKIQKYQHYPKFVTRMLNEEWKEEARSLYKSGFTPEVYVLWSRHGNTGKSTRFVYDTHGCDNICRANISKSGNLWWENYMGESILLIEDFEGQTKFKHWKHLTDRYPIQLEIGKQRAYRWCVRKRIYFTSNKHPDDWWKLEAIEREQLHRRITKTMEITECEPVIM